MISIKKWWSDFWWSYGDAIVFFSIVVVFGMILGVIDHYG